MKKIYILVLLMTAIAFPSAVFSSTSAPISLVLNGTVSSRNLVDITQILGTAPNIESAIPLDSGDVLAGAEGIGVKVGTWRVNSNTGSALDLIATYTPFSASIGGSSYSIPYVLNNGTDFVLSGEEFAALVRSEGIYSQVDNSGDIWLKRTDNNSYPPSTAYLATITFSLSTE